MTTYICPVCGKETAEKGTGFCQTFRCSGKPVAHEVAGEAALPNITTTPTTPVQYVDSYCPTKFSRVDFGVDAEGRKCERKYRREVFISEGGDSIRDASAGRSIETGAMVAGEWKLV